MERKKPKKPHIKGKGERELLIGSETWFWKVGKSFVSILSPNGKRTNIDKYSSEIAENTETVNDPSIWDSNIYITPTSVYNYIVRNRDTIS